MSAAWDTTVAHLRERGLVGQTGSSWVGLTIDGVRFTLRRASEDLAVLDTALGDANAVDAIAALHRGGELPVGGLVIDRGWLILRQALPVLALAGESVERVSQLLASWVARLGSIVRGGTPVVDLFDRFA